MDEDIAIIIEKSGNKCFADHHYKFFKAYKGGYGEGDMFYGVKVPVVREIAKKYGRDVSEKELHNLLINPYHEVRMCALIILNLFFMKKNEVAAVDFYLRHVDYINNWDLVDLSAPYILGKYVYEHSDSSILKTFSESKKLWRERISVVSCLYLIKRRKFDDIFVFAENFLSHEHDLIHKACGWMLREVGKVNKDILKDFLNHFYRKMPRTMLRYAIERFDADERAFYMKK